MTEQSPEAESPYQDPALIERAGGDKRLLDRLVALYHAEEMFDKNPNDKSKKALRDTMQEEVEAYEQGRGSTS